MIKKQEGKRSNWKDKRRTRKKKEQASVGKEQQQND